jgi:hypothetical protein
MAINLQKGGDQHKIDLTKGKTNITVHANLNWNQTVQVKKGFLASIFGGGSDGPDLDLGCMYEMQNGNKGVIQPLGKNFGNKSQEPYIFLDKSNNSMYIRFSKLEADEFKDKSTISSIPELHKFLTTGIAIDYVPLQRWVHIAVVCNSTAFKTTLFAYVDGDLAKTISHNEIFTLKGYEDNYHINSNHTCDTGTMTANNKEVICKGTLKSDLNNLNLNATGFLYVGNNRDYKSGVGPGFSGLLASFVSYNYELNQQDIYAIYNNGPVTGFLAKLGLGAYGVRNPVYKL